MNVSSDMSWNLTLFHPFQEIFAGYHDKKCEKYSFQFEIRAFALPFYGYGLRKAVSLCYRYT